MPKIGLLASLFIEAAVIAIAIQLTLSYFMQEHEIFGTIVGVFTVILICRRYEIYRQQDLEP